ncbi:hypothetical protein GCM10019059_07490 [Camelimonas fluminis]|uniref:Uncharacterized protein n=1 Tax=Camelimonas fluminis TaxID=1576911 RepID=A0ABV7UEG0_9HYPH|nr:hypothetical protein [Camelimonas fluminis]GHE50880.1 hypothetical protein GCM10019059_07490 [Camelimonas fluminis]
MTSSDRLQPLHRIAQGQHRRMGTRIGHALVRAGIVWGDGVALAALWLGRPSIWMVSVGVWLVRHSRAPP